jgi:signal transduction histidine kinase/CheY-like chemotaxis protein
MTTPATKTAAQRTGTVARSFAESGHNDGSFSLRHAYVLLAVLASVAVLACVQLTREITRIHTTSLQESKVWTERVNKYVALRAMASAASLPANELAESNNAAGEAAKFARAAAAFDEAVAAIRADLAADSDPAAKAVLAGVENIATAAANMYAHVTETLDRFGRGLAPTQAGTPAALDRDLKDVNTAITKVTTMVRAIQVAGGERAVAAASTLRGRQHVVAGMTLPLVILLTLMGWRVSRRLSTLFRELCDARAAAERSNRTKGEFLANMSHEIRTPMTAILGFADMLSEGASLTTAAPEQAEAVQTIQRNGKYLLNLLSDILDLSKIEAGRLTAERIPCSPCHVLAEVESLMRVRSQAKRLEFSVEYAGPLPETISSDPTRLRQILINIVGNAIKFTEVGSVRLIARFEPAGDSQPALEFDVVDTGIGMSKEQAARLFEPFTQADSTTTRKFGGTGLGVTISKRLAEVLGGDVQLVETAPGKGTRFRLTVPVGPLDSVKLIEDPLTAAIVTREPPEPTREQVSDPLDGRILLAEDGPDNQRLIAHVLRRAGAEVVVAENGQLAVEAAVAAREQGRPFDLILMDMQMPVMDGYQATALLREKSFLGPIIALTAHAMATDRQKCIQAGCDDYASKPIDRAHLIETIHNRLRIERQARPRTRTAHHELAQGL